MKTALADMGSNSVRDFRTQGHCRLVPFGLQDVSALPSVLTEAHLFRSQTDHAFLMSTRLFLVHPPYHHQVNIPRIFILSGHSPEDDDKLQELPISYKVCVPQSEI